MKTRWVVVLGGIFLVAGFVCFYHESRAQERYPVKPITHIVPLEAGADGDLMTRPLVQKVSALLGQTVLVVNKPGAGSTIGYREIYGAKPDGYTIGTAFTSLVQSKLMGLLPYDHNDYTMIGTYYSWNAIIVGTTKGKRPFKTIQEVLTFAKANPGEVSIATTSVGGGWWMATMVFQDGTGLKFNVIPQEGAGAFSIAQVAGGHVDLAILGVAAAKSQIEAGNVKFLAILGPKRLPGQYSDVPTLKELGYNAIYHTTSCVIGPPKMPKPIVDKLVKTFETATNDPEYQKFINERGAMVTHMLPEQAIQTYNEQRDQFRPIMEKAGILKEK